MTNGYQKYIFNFQPLLSFQWRRSKPDIIINKYNNTYIVNITIVFDYQEMSKSE